MTRPAIHKNPLSYEARLESRYTTAIELIVIHCTELPDLETARQYGEKICYPDSGTGNSGHFYIDRDGHIEQWADPLRIAHHVAGNNETSIGIELVNLGRFPDWLHSEAQEMRDPDSEAQISALVTLLEWLIKTFPGLSFIAGHEDLDQREVSADNRPGLLVRRKMDPGPLFPWDRLFDTISLTRRII